MGKPFLLLDEFLTTIDNNEVIVEIGSDRGNGSTEYFAFRAIGFNTKLITVDIDDSGFNQWKHSKQNLNELNGVVEFYHMSGSEFTKNILPGLGVKIKCLYLDNYDWNWDPSSKIDYIYNQIDWYKRKHNINMNNMDCQIEHMKQMLGAMPYMANDAFVIVDDTYQREDAVFTGKCGPVVTYLLANKYKILKIIPGEGLIMQRTI